MSTILIGGVSRAGKSLLARRIHDLRGHSVCAGDTLAHAFLHAFPSLGITPYARNLETWRNTALRLWPFLREMILRDRKAGMDVVYESCFLWPDAVAEVASEPDLTILFLSYHHMTPAAKLATIREAVEAGGLCYSPRYSDAEMIAMISLCQEVGREQAALCDEVGIAHHTIGADFEREIEALARLLTRDP